MARKPSTPNPQIESGLMTDLSNHAALDDLDLTLPDGWYLLSKEEYGEEVFFCQHEEHLRSTDTHADPADAVEAAQKKEGIWEAATHDTPDENGESNDLIFGGGASDEQSAPTEVLDEEAGEYVELTPELRAKAQHAIKQIQAGILVTAYWVSRVYDERLYVGLGYGTKKQFVENHLPFGMSQARKYAKIGRRFGDFLPDYAEQTPEKLPAGEDAEETPESLQGIPMTKLTHLTKLDDEDLQSYVEEGKWTGPNGETYTRDDVMEMARAELDDAVSGRGEKLQKVAEDEKEKRQAYQELAEKRKEEKEALEEELDERQQQIESAEELELRLGPKQSKLESKKKLYRECEEHIEQAIRIVDQLDPGDHPDTDELRCRAIRKAAQRLLDVVHEDFVEVLMTEGF